MNKIIKIAETLSIDRDFVNDIENAVDVVAEAIDSELETLRPWCGGAKIQVTSVTVVCEGATSGQLHSGKEFKAWISTIL